MPYIWSWLIRSVMLQILDKVVAFIIAIAILISSVLV